MNDDSLIHRSTVSYKELPLAKAGDHFFREWNTYLRNLELFLADGHEGRIRDESILGIFETEEAAREEGLRRFLLSRHLVQPIRSREPILRVRGYNMPWPTSVSRSAQAG